MPKRSEPRKATAAPTAKPITTNEAFAAGRKAYEDAVNGATEEKFKQKPTFTEDRAKYVQDYRKTTR